MDGCLINCESYFKEKYTKYFFWKTWKGGGEKLQGWLEGIIKIDFR